MGDSCLTTPLYYRESDYLYTLRSHVNYYFCVGESPDLKHLWGPAEETVAHLLFKPDGELWKVKDYPWSDFVPEFDSTSYPVLLELASKRLSVEFQMVQRPISVKRFWLDGRNIGIEDLPEDMKEFLLHPERFNDTERREYEASVERWKESLFLFFSGSRTFT